MQALIVESDPDLSLVIAYNLEAEGFRVEQCERGDIAQARLEREPVPDLLILEWNLPGLSGLEICRSARGRLSTRDIPIIMVTVRGAERDRVQGLETGADDYIIKPFSTRELIARVHAVLRRARRPPVADVQVIGDIVLDRNTRRVKRDERDIHLSPLEFKLLALLMQRPGQVFAREQLLGTIWAGVNVRTTRTVDVNLGRLRKVLSIGPELDPIKTLHGEGYVFDATFGRSKATPD